MEGLSPLRNGVSPKHLSPFHLSADCVDTLTVKGEGMFHPSFTGRVVIFHLARMLRSPYLSHSLIFCDLNAMFHRLASFTVKTVGVTNKIVLSCRFCGGSKKICFIVDNQVGGRCGGSVEDV